MSKSSIFAKVILLASAWMLALGADAVQPLAQIDITNEVYTAAQTDDKISEAMAGVSADKITDGTNTLSANLDYEYEKVLTNTWVVNGIPYTTTTGYTYCSYFPPNPNENDIGYTLTLNEGSSWEFGYYDLMIGAWYWRNQGTEEDPDYQWVADSGGATGLLPANGTSFSLGGFVGTYPIKRMEKSKLALTNDIPPAVTVVAPSTNATVGTAADAKAVGTALYTGFTEWECVPATYNGKTLHVEYSNGEWSLYADNQLLDPPEGAPYDTTSLTFSVYDVTATRHLVTPTKTSQLTNDFGFITSADIANKRDKTDFSVSGRPEGNRSWFVFDGNDFLWVGECWTDGSGVSIYKNTTAPEELPYLMTDTESETYFDIDESGVGLVYWRGAWQKIFGYTDTLAVENQIPTKTSQLTNNGAPNGGGMPYATTNQIPDVTGKADKVSGATAGNLASLNAQGNIADSGTKPSDFATKADLPYRLVEPGEWEFSGSGYDPTKTYYVGTVSVGTEYYYELDIDGVYTAESDTRPSDDALVVEFASAHITATRASLPGHLLNRSVNNVPVSTPTSLFFPSNIIGKTSDFYLNLVVSNEPQLSVSFFDSDSNPISWVEAPPQNFNVGTNIIHIVEVSENTYIFSKIGTSDSGELTNVRIKGTLSQGHTSAIATGAFSNSQGTNTIAIGVASHAEGSSTTAEGNYAHSEGNGTYARGVASHSEGLFTRATERASHSSGACALATNSWSFVWSGLERSPYYGSHGVSTFNVNPINGLYGFFLGEKTLEEMIADSILSPALVTNIVVAYDTGIEPSDDSTEPATSEVTVTYGTLRAAIATAVGETITNPMSQLGGMSLPEYISTIKKYEWDEARQVSYRRCISNDFIILTYATNINLTAAENLSALKAYEDSIAVRKPPQVTSGYTVGYESASYSDKIIATGGDYFLEGSNLSGASLSITYDVSGTPTTETIPDSSITTTTDTITIASAALSNARSNGGTVTFAIQTAYGSTTATAVVASVSP